MAKAQQVAVHHLQGRGADAAGLGCCRLGAGMLGQQAGGGDVVGVCVGLQRPAQLEPVLPQHRQIALYLLVHRVDDDGIAGGLVKDDVGVSAGRGVE